LFDSTDMRLVVNPR